MSDLPSSAPDRRLIVAMTGATGSIYGLRLLDAVRATPGWESHLIVSDAGMLNLWQAGPVRAQGRYERAHARTQRA